MPRRLGIAGYALLGVIAAAVLVGGIRELVDGNLGHGLFLILGGMFGGVVTHRSIVHRRGSEPTAFDAALGAALFAFMGLVGLYSAVTGGAAATIAGAVAAAILFPLSLLSLRAAWSGRRRCHGDGQSDG